MWRCGGSRVQWQCGISQSRDAFASSTRSNVRGCRPPSSPRCTRSSALSRPARSRRMVPWLRSRAAARVVLALLCARTVPPRRACPDSGSSRRIGVWADLAASGARPRQPCSENVRCWNPKESSSTRTAACRRRAYSASCPRRVRSVRAPTRRRRRSEPARRRLRPSSRRRRSASSSRAIPARRADRRRHRGGSLLRRVIGGRGCRRRTPRCATWWGAAASS